MFAKLKSFLKQEQTRARIQRVESSCARMITAVCVAVSTAVALYMFVQRFAHLTNGFQYDELYSAVTAWPTLPLPFIWKEMLLQDVNLPLFNVSLWGWTRIFPFTPFWLHLYSALLGALAVVSAWVFAPKYWSLLKKWIFVTLMSGAFILVAYGAIIRTYSLAILCTTVFSLQALTLLDCLCRRQAPAVSQWMWFFGAGLAGAYSHYFSAALFFAAALILFIYACCYKTGRAWTFWGTAAVFAVWSFWLIHTLWFMSRPGSSWWFATPVLKATLDALEFLLGSIRVFTVMLYASIIALVSLAFTDKKEIVKRADVILPLGQILLLLLVLSVISARYNLWLDRYFLPAMPVLLLLLAEFLVHLYRRHALWLVLWPLLLVCWVHSYLKLDHLHWAEYTGLREAFSYLTEKMQAPRVFIDMARTGYPDAALPYMFNYYVPPGRKLEIIRLTKQNAADTWRQTPKAPILMPLCSHIHLIYTAVENDIDEDGVPLVFGRDICVYTVHPIVKKEAASHEEENIHRV